MGLHTGLHPVNPALIKVGFTYGVAPRKPRLYKKLFIIWDCTPYGGLRGRAPVIHFTDQ